MTARDKSDRQSVEGSGVRPRMRASVHPTKPEVASPVSQYRFGFLVLPTDRPLENGDEMAALAKAWTRTGLGNLVLWIHPETRYGIAALGSSRLALIGDVYATAEGSVEALLAAAPVETDADLAALSGRLGGRFALLIVEASRLRLLHDAFGSRTVFYTPREPRAAASHAHLLARALGIPESQGGGRANRRYELPQAEGMLPAGRHDDLQGSLRTCPEQPQRFGCRGNAPCAECRKCLTDSGSAGTTMPSRNSIFSLVTSSTGSIAWACGVPACSTIWTRRCPRWSASMTGRSMPPPSGFPSRSG